MSLSSRFLRLAPVVPAIVLAVGCAKPTPVGKWSGVINNAGQSTIEFTADNKVTLNGTVALLGAIVATGTYSLEGEKISIKITDVAKDGKSVMAMIPANLRGALDQNTTWKIEGETLDLGGTKLTKVP